ncbi:transposase family protein [Myroides odoratimimus]|uniref:transposase family protein n=1 Tax=Myroides odoratimimus TaxID=76832 RepID=UPI0033079DC3
MCVAKQTKPTTPYTKYSKLPSSKLHSYYIRKIVDLPIFGKQTLIKLKARKFYCSTLECPLKIFTERFKSIFSSYQRRSDRLTKKLLNLVILTGGRPIEKICAEFSVTISDTSLLRIIVYIPMKVHHHSDKVHQLDYLL